MVYPWAKANIFSNFYNLIHESIKCDVTLCLFNSSYTLRRPQNYSIIGFFLWNFLDGMAISKNSRTIHWIKSVNYDLYYLSTNFFMFVINSYLIIYVWLKFMFVHMTTYDFSSMELLHWQGKHFFQTFSIILTHESIKCDVTVNSFYLIWDHDCGFMSF